ncbi:unnamed protein product [Albugo candida]|uniref:Flap endonuclease 1 n=1 Tax=Albugo candida TaxID=65357 RepID=A0A024GLR2_9STRA|nr:unnamed protein product [Albugo candida]|eukprot:CCI47820.1 unnamed protein product [Albugo candida]
MGIKGLMKLLQEEAPSCIREVQMSHLAGRSIAIDASMALYQFLIAIRSNDGAGPAQVLTNEQGEDTSHLQGMFSRTIRLMENGIKPVYVFDGKPPVMKSKELEKRKDRRNAANKSLEEANEAGNLVEIDRFSKRLVQATSQHSQDCKELLRLMGVPVLTAPCEAEATCAMLAKHHKVYASGTEDMDVLTFGTPVLYRRMTVAANKKVPILEIKLEQALKALDLSEEQFVDLCILCGCDYCDSIRGIGPKKAFNGIKEHKTIENFLQHLQQSNNKGVVIPDEWLGDDPIYKRAREMFLNAEVIDVNDVDLKWKEPLAEELNRFLVDKHGFRADRVTTGIEKLKKSRSTQSQKRLDSFFKAVPGAATSTKKREAVNSKHSASKKSRSSRPK